EEDIKKGTKEPEKEAPVIESELGTQPTSGAWDMRQLGYSSPAAINTPVFQMCTHSLWASLAAANLEVYNCQNLKRYNHPDKKGVSGFHGNAEEGTPKNGQRSSGYTKKDNQFSTASVGCLSNSMESSIREGIITHECYDFLFSKAHTMFLRYCTFAYPVLSIYTVTSLPIKIPSISYGASPTAPPT
ncbi:hypothetical protein MJT46_010959, partial [Ovis ammon polii x Ovis aries]